MTWNTRYPGRCPEIHMPRAEEFGASKLVVVEFARLALGEKVETRRLKVIVGRL